MRMTDVRETDGLVVRGGAKHQGEPQPWGWVQEFSLGWGPGDRQPVEKFQEEIGDGEV